MAVLSSFYGRKTGKEFSVGAVGFVIDSRDRIALANWVFLFCVVTFLPLSKVVEHGLPGLFMMDPRLEKGVFAAWAFLAYLILLSVKRRAWVAVDGTRLFMRWRGALFETWRAIDLTTISYVEYGRPFGVGQRYKRPRHIRITTAGKSLILLRYDPLSDPGPLVFLAELVSDATGLPLVLQRVQARGYKNL